MEPLRARPARLADIEGLYAGQHVGLDGLGPWSLPLLRLEGSGCFFSRREESSLEGDTPKKI